MNRKLITQTLNEWRANLWLAVELLIVSVVVWYAVDFCYVTYRNYIMPLGFEIDHCYKIYVQNVTDGSPEHVERSDEETASDYLELIDRIKRRPEVEYASYSNMAHPYNTSTVYSQICIDSSYTWNARLYYSTADFMNVFRLRGVNGETPEQLAEMMRSQGSLISSEIFGDSIDARTVVNDSIYDMNSNNTIIVGGVYVPMRDSEYSASDRSNASIIQRIDMSSPDWVYRADELCVRVRDNMDRDFARTLMADADKHYRVGNLFISSVVSFDSIRDSYIRDSRQTVLAMLSGIAFLLVNVFLGLFGTFWFRTQQRVSEIAIRKVNGATRSAIFRRFIGEGLIILSVVTPLAIGIDAVLSHYEIGQEFEDSFLTYDRLMICALISYALLGIMIVCGVAIPAYRAMSIEPAVALHDE